MGLDDSHACVVRRRRLAGRDTLGAEYQDVDQMWEAEAGSKRQKEDWYNKGTPARGCGWRVSLSYL